jgi:hypothetical protein
MNYQSAFDLAKTARDGRKKPIGNNTWLIIDLIDKDEVVSVRLHQTDIVTFWPDGSIVLNSGGWETNTTKSRINDFLDRPRLYSEKSVWVVESGDIDYFFEDGMVIKPDGTIDGQPVFAKKLEKITGKSLDTYRELLTALKGLSIEDLIKSWKMFKRDRGFIATHCREDFLPLTIGTTGDGHESWRQVVADRLRRVA